MTFNRRMIVLCSVLAVVLGIGFSVGCNFFVNPTLTTITVTPPTPSITQGTTLQMTGTGTFNDGSIKTLTGNVFWTTSSSTVATVSNSGLVSALAPGTATITASSANISGSTTITVSVANLVSITIAPTNPSIKQGSTQQFTATGSIQGGGTVDITDSVTWTVTGSNMVNISSTGLVSTTGTFTVPVTVVVQATTTSNTGTLTAQTNLTINP